MRARVAGAGVAGVLLVCGAGGGAWATTTPPEPGPGGLDVQVARLTQAERAEVVGAQAAAMLFSREGAGALARARADAVRDRAEHRRTLFLVPVPQLREPTPTAGLFPAADAAVVPAPHAAAPDAGGAAEVGAAEVGAAGTGGPPWGPAAGGALAAVGGAGSVVLNRSRREVARA